MKKNKPKKLIEVACWEATFKTVDENFHKRSFLIYEKGIVCSPIRYIMLCVNDDKAITADDGTTYPIYNIVSIEWKRAWIANVVEDDRIFYKHSDIVVESVENAAKTRL